MLNRTFKFSRGEVLVHVYFEDNEGLPLGEPLFHVALRYDGERTWGPPLGQLTNQDADL